MIYLLAIAQATSVLLLALIVGALGARVSELEQFQSDVIAGADGMSAEDDWEEITVPDARQVQGVRR